MESEFFKRCRDHMAKNLFETEVDRHLMEIVFRETGSNLDGRLLTFQPGMPVILPSNAIMTDRIDDVFMIGTGFVEWRVAFANVEFPYEIWVPVEKRDEFIARMEALDG